MAIKYLNALAIKGNGGTVLDVQGSQGQLFSVTDSLTGDIFAVSDISGVPILKVNSSGLSTFDGNVNLPDNNKILLGTGNDLQIYHDGSNSYIKDTGTGSLIIQSSDLFLRTNSTENAIVCAANASVTLYYNNVSKLATTSTGVTVTGSAGISIQGTNATGAESILIQGFASTDTLGSIRTANTGGYNQDMRFYTSNVIGQPETLALTLNASQNAIFAGTITGQNIYGNQFVDAQDNAYYANPAATSVMKGASFDGNVTVTTQAIGDDSTLVATTEYADRAATAVPIGDYLPLAGGTMANTNLVTNMNADLLDGKDYTDFGATLATYGSTAGASGRIRITAPFNTNSGHMFQITVSIYSSYTIHTYVVGGYMYSTTNQWHGAQAVYSGTGAPDIVVGRDSNGKAYISIANGNYTGVRVHNMTLGYYTTIDDTYDPWTITIDGAVPNSVTPGVYKTWTSGNDGAGSGLDADLLDGQEGSYYLDYANFTGTPTIPTVGDGEINGATSGLGITGSMSATANQTDDTTFTVTSNAVTAATASTLVYRDSTANINAAKYNGLAINTSGTNNVANQIVRTEANGYVNFGWINSVSGATTSTITRITASNDAYLRYVTPATFRSQVIAPYFAPIVTGGYLPLVGGTMAGTITMDNHRITSIEELRFNNGGNISNQINTDVDIATETVANVPIADYTAAFYDFVIKKGTNVRSGTVYACHDGTNVEYTETSTNDLGDTSDVTLSVAISGTNMKLLATATSVDWSVKSLIRAI